MEQQPAPGMRVEIRDAEWRIKRVDYSSDGGYVLSCEGQSELVRGREIPFLTKLESVRVLDPRETELVDDTSGNFSASLLYIDSQLRKTAPSDEQLHLGQHAAIDHMNYQLEPALQALQQPRQRILIADAVGLGKTLEAGILTSELIARGRGKRILVLATKSMLGQFQQEFWSRFTIPLVRLDSVGLQRVRNRIPANHNPFHYFDRSIISIDTLKQDIEYRHHLEQAYWDIIIIDEAHNVADRGSNSQRSKLARLLSTRSDTLMMLSATPHDGKAESFASLVNMLDPTAIADPKNYQKQDYRDKGLVIRRFKKDVRDELRGNFPEREIEVASTRATAPEEAAYDQLTNVSFHNLDGRGQGAGQLFRTTLEKALFSSPQACLSTVRNRMDRLNKRLEKERDDEKVTTLVEDIDTLQGLASSLEAITPDQFSKYQLLKDQIRELGWTAKDTEDRLVIFTESIVTLEFLRDQLPGDLGLKDKQTALLRGDMVDKDQMDTVDQFNRAESPIRLLICSDVAAEGINLHHLCHRMIHFDIPWSLMVFQQRNGRIDRYGQTRQPQIRYLQTESDNAKVRGDQRVLEVLVNKDEQASRNIGDPSEFMGLYDEDAETEKVAETLESDEAGGFDLASVFEEMLDQQQENSEGPLANFTPETGLASQQQAVSPLPRVFPSGLEYAKTAISWLRENGESLSQDTEVDGQFFRIQAPEDLKQRLKFLPSEVCGKDDYFVLTPEKERIDEEIRRTRQEEDAAWPSIHYLWPIHPVMEWLSDRALNAFGRHTAPVLRLTGKLGQDEHIVLVHGGFPNRRGHVLVQDWVGFRIQAGEVTERLNWDELQSRYNLRPNQIPNPGNTGETASLQSLLPVAVRAAEQHLKTLKENFEAERGPELEKQYQRLRELKGEHEQQLEMELSQSGETETKKTRKRNERQQQIDRVFDDYRDWLDNTQKLENKPYIQVAAVLTGKEA
ncbi:MULTISPECIES: SNF2-related protein [Halomonadaceae]|uniref:DEAD/DEAH box helicase n=1 Tax=Vreelandella halophila TaxID=86177 RepID=A0A9X4YEA0_9GAMM|nr:MULTISPECIES: SNF2-related protein [Halomonas]MYL28159.1 DEAD/DEAH box helicase [Halomonas utahensis]MYL76066.1 DEAD/DEAH box helicase [Halomonas sp. 22501_18_FS]